MFVESCFAGIATPSGELLGLQEGKHLWEPSSKFSLLAVPLFVLAYWLVLTPAEKGGGERDETALFCLPLACLLCLYVCTFLLCKGLQHSLIKKKFLVVTIRD